MPLPPDNELLLDFEGGNGDARHQLEVFGDAFRYQLVMARHVEHRAVHFEELRAAGQLADVFGGRYADGYVTALRHIALDLRAGGYLPGGSSYEDTIKGE
jgi:hypothetical protein